MTDEELKALVAGLAAAQDRTDEQLAKTDAQLAKTDAKLNKLAEMYSDDGPSLREVAKEFFYNGLEADPVLGGVRFDYICSIGTRSHAGISDYFDLLLVNGREVFVVEVKHKAHENDLERLLGEKAPNFRHLFPEHAGRRQRLALATFHIHDDLKKSALARGVTVLQRRGDVIETFAA